jgi:hypothetical protein
LLSNSYTSVFSLFELIKGIDRSKDSTKRLGILKGLDLSRDLSAIEKLPQIKKHPKVLFD